MSALGPTDHPTEGHPVQPTMNQHGAVVSSSRLDARAVQGCLSHEIVNNVSLQSGGTVQSAPTLLRCHCSRRGSELFGGELPTSFHSYTLYKWALVVRG